MNRVEESEDDLVSARSLLPERQEEIGVATREATRASDRIAELQREVADRDADIVCLKRKIAEQGAILRSTRAELISVHAQLDQMRVEFVNTGPTTTELTGEEVRKAAVDLASLRDDLITLEGILSAAKANAPGRAVESVATTIAVKSQMASVEANSSCITGKRLALVQPDRRNGRDQTHAPRDRKSPEFHRATPAASGDLRPLPGPPINRI